MLQKYIRLLILPLQRFQLLYAATLLILLLKRSCNPPGRCNATNAVTATPYATNAATATGVFLLLLGPVIWHSDRWSRSAIRLVNLTRILPG